MNNVSGDITVFNSNPTGAGTFIDEENNASNLNLNVVKANGALPSGNQNSASVAEPVIETVESVEVEPAVIEPVAEPVEVEPVEVEPVAEISNTEVTNVEIIEPVAAIEANDTQDLTGATSFIPANQAENVSAPSVESEVNSISIQKP